MAYRCKELHLDDTVKVIFHEFKDAVGRAAPILIVSPSITLCAIAGGATVNATNIAHDAFIVKRLPCTNQR
jgi:hypothetical protein